MGDYSPALMRFGGSYLGGFFIGWIFRRFVKFAIMLAGGALLIIGLLKPDPVVGNWPLRALCILPAATVIFGFLMERAGFIPAMIALIYVSAWAGSEFKFWEVTVLAVVLTAASVGLFIYGLGLPYPLLGGA